MAKKKKMTKAQAAAARKEVTPERAAKARTQEAARQARQVQQRVQKEKRKSPLTIIVVGGILVLAVFILAWVLTVGPGFVIG